MILLDTGPIVALFDPADASHRPCAEILKAIVEPLGTTYRIKRGHRLRTFEVIGPAATRR